ncbi:MAG: proprotein convertase P-domain-containing protein [Proteobacteria bacterium]|nr:proprotein convertase P-domain-containing protein [Pseudomonadota bacterium]
MLAALLMMSLAIPAQAAVPAAPTSCSAGLHSTTFTQSTPLAIPTDPAVVTSTIVVSGAQPYLWDVDVTTFLRHTFSADLDVTITSPAGTVVTLTTDNGGSNDDVFNGTVWDDSASELVTDHVYANLTTAPSLVPEEALGAFVGEDPNGTWTITISDDLAGDGGSLDSWSLSIATLPAAPTTQTSTYTQPTGVAIADLATTTSTLDVAGAGAAILDVNVTTFITHTFPADLDIVLVSPSGTRVTLTTDNGAGNDDVFNGTVWDDSADPGGQVPYTSDDGLVTDHAYVNGVTASPLVPEGALSALMGEDPNGTWQLEITDDLGGDVGNLASWSIQVTTASCALAIVAGSDSGSVTTTGGTAVADVRVNDTLDGAPATSANTTLTVEGSTPAGITLTAAGAVLVAAGVAPGSYMFTYRLAESAAPTNYTLGTVTVMVSPAVLAAGNDSGSVLTTGGTAIADVRANDTVDGAPATAANTTLAVEGAWPAGITLSASGAVNVAPGVAPGGNVIQYRLTDIADPTNYVIGTVTVTVARVGTVAGGATPIPVDAPWALLLGGLALAIAGARRFLRR